MEVSIQNSKNQLVDSVGLVRLKLEVSTKLEPLSSEEAVVCLLFLNIFFLMSLVFFFFFFLQQKKKKWN